MNIDDHPTIELKLSPALQYELTQLRRFINARTDKEAIIHAITYYRLEKERFIESKKELADLTLKYDSLMASLESLIASVNNLPI